MVTFHTVGRLESSLLFRFRSGVLRPFGDLEFNDGLGWSFDLLLAILAARIRQPIRAATSCLVSSPRNDQEHLSNLEVTSDGEQRKGAIRLAGSDFEVMLDGYPRHRFFDAVLHRWL
jgi:hypothetical protein